MRIRLIALDLDGTALDSEGRVGPALMRSLASARDAGIRVIGCTGRRHRTAAPVLRELGIRGPTVVQNGVLVKDAESGETLVCRKLSQDLYDEALRLFRQIASPLVYADSPPDADADFYYEAIDRAPAFQAEYLRDHGASGRLWTSLDEPPPGDLVMMSVMADPVSLAPLRAQMRDRLGSGARTHLIENKNYRGSILEVVPPGAGKWAGILDICVREGIDPAQVMAIGDDHNDADMVERAGIGVAMGNAVDAVKQVAAHVTASNDDNGAAIAIERFALSDSRTG